jgi:hypothetical protein
MMYILCKTKWGRSVRFTQWVRAQAERDDKIGELARRVPDWPCGRARLDDLHAHLEAVGADGWDIGEAHRALDGARAAWRCWRWPSLYGCDRAA